MITININIIISTTPQPPSWPPAWCPHADGAPLIVSGAEGHPSLLVLPFQLEGHIIKQSPYLLRLHAVLIVASMRLLVAHVAVVGVVVVVVVVVNIVAVDVVVVVVEVVVFENLRASVLEGGKDFGEESCILPISPRHLVPQTAAVVVAC